MLSDPENAEKLAFKTKVWAKFCNFGEIFEVFCQEICTFRSIVKAGSVALDVAGSVPAYGFFFCFADQV